MAPPVPPCRHRTAATAQRVPGAENHSDEDAFDRNHRHLAASPAPEQEPTRTETGHRLHRGRRSRDERVERHAPGQPAPRAQPVEQSPGDGLHDRVANAKADQQPGEIGVGPPIALLEHRRQRTDGLAIEIVDHHRREQQRRDPPAKIRDRRAHGGRSRHHHCACGGTPSDLPPSIRSTVPVTIAAASLTRYKIASATSSGVIMRPSARASGLAAM